MNSRGARQIANGTFRWWLDPQPGLVNARIEFTPTSTLAAVSKTIAFVQTVQTTTPTGFWGGSSTSSNEVDKGAADRDPFFGAQWRGGDNTWRDEPTATQARSEDLRGGATPPPREGSSPVTAGGNKSAVLNDSPMLNIDEVKQFETAAIVVESGQLLGSLSWTIQRRKAGFFNEGSSTIVRTPTVLETSTPDLQKALDYYYGAKSAVSGFGPGSADLPPGHEAALAKPLAKLSEAEGITVILGGAATKDETDPAALARRRADAVKNYLSAHGVATSRIGVEVYGSDWARAAGGGAGADQANRRVEVDLVVSGQR
ncbi:OmpA family protein [Nocardia testacea]|uniref:OmpA family protein n=1 Tax=Nocardia testacea TaxID=248551 RepID=A0ABW7VQ56_9NOCA